MRIIADNNIIIIITYYTRACFILMELSVSTFTEQYNIHSNCIAYIITACIIIYSDDDDDDDDFTKTICRPRARRTAPWEICGPPRRAVVTALRPGSVPRRRFTRNDIIIIIIIIIILL